MGAGSAPRFLGLRAMGNRGIGIGGGHPTRVPSWRWEGPGEGPTPDTLRPFLPVRQECLEAFAGAAESRFGCLVAGGRLALATEPWWQLAPQELLLLSWLVGSLPPHAARDYPIYLPHGSPTVSAWAGGEVGGWSGGGGRIEVSWGDGWGADRDRGEVWMPGSWSAGVEVWMMGGCQGGRLGAQGFLSDTAPPRSPTGSSPASCCPAWRPA